MRATLNNGLQVVIVRDPLAPVVTTVVNYQVGSNETPPDFPGTAHAVEHMMFRGSPGLSADQLAEIAAAMGGNFDADTQQTVTQYFFSVPAEDLGLALRIEAIRMRDLLSTPALWRHERGAIEQEVVQDLSSPEYVCYTRLLAALFRGTPYAHDALGTRASFNRTSAAMLRQFHATWYAPNNAILVIAGNVDPSLALAQARRFFGSIPRKKLPARAPVRLQPVTPVTLHFDTDQPYGTALIAFRLPGYDDPDYAAASVLADALSSQRGDLYDLVAQGKALSAGFSLNPLPQATLGLAAVAYPSGADTEALLNEVRRILQEKITRGISPDLVEAARRRALARAAFQKNSISGLAMLWSQALAIEGRASPDEDLAAIKRVTPADVDRVARKYLGPGSRRHRRADARGLGPAGKRELRRARVVRPRKGPDGRAAGLGRQGPATAFDRRLQRPSGRHLDDVRDYYRRTYRPDLTTIVVIGRISPAEARATIEKYFGDWKAVGPKPETLLPPVPPNQPAVMTVPDRNRIQDEVALAETLGLNRFNPDYYALQLGNHVLGGGFYATRLYRDLRENAGLVYYIASSFDVGQTRAVYRVNYACDPPNVPRVRAIVQRELKAMQTAPITENELRNAKANLLREIPLAEASTDGIAMGLLARVDRDLPLDEPLRAARQYADLTTEAVTATFAKWIRPQDLVQITQGPAPH